MQRCASCGGESPAGFAFCGSCGAELARPPLSTMEERKVVSVLFVDLVGFTERSDRADPEDVQAVLRPFYATVKREIEAFGGTVEKYIGDAIVGVFGAPRVHEDDPERAVRSALRIIEAIHELNRVHSALGLAVRVAVNTGEAIVSLESRPELGEGFVAGDVVNTASRLQAIAQPASVIVGEATWKATADVIDYEPLDPVRVKGKADEITVWRALRTSALGRSRDSARPITPFIGRDEDLALLRSVYQRCFRVRSPHLVHIVGEAGSGKTRLLAELKASVSEEATWRQGKCLPYGEGVTFWALSEIVKQEARILDSDGPVVAAMKIRNMIESTVATSEDREWMASWVAPLVGAKSLPGTEAGHGGDSFRAWTAFFQAVAARAPLVLLFEDFQWAVDALVEFVSHLCESADGPLLVICTSRLEFFERFPDWGGGTRNATNISLGPLARDETIQLVTALLDGARLPDGTQEAMLKQSGGNPLYAQEFVRMLVDAGLSGTEDGFVLPRVGDEIPVPESIQGLITARLDALPLELKKLAQTASVVGEAFWEGTLAAVHGGQARAVRDGLRELCRRELIRLKQTSTVENESEYSFSHLVVRDVAYHQIPRPERAQKHVTVAEWIEGVYGDRVNDAAELLAHHYTSALELARLAGDHERTEVLRSRALRFLVLAGDRALRLDAEAATSLYQRALDLSTTTDADRARILLSAGEAAHQAGRLAEATRYYEDATDAYRRLEDLLGAGEALVRLSRLKWWQGQVARAQELLEEGVSLLEQRPPGRELALAYARVAGSHATAGRHHEGKEWAARTLELAAELKLDDVSVRALQYRGLARCEAGDLGGLVDLHAALERGIDLGLGHETATAYDNLGDWLWLTEGPRAGLDMNRAGVDFAVRRGQAETATWTKAETLWMLFDCGEWDEVLRIAAEVIAWDDWHGHNQVGVIARTHVALVALWRDDADPADERLASILSRARSIGDPEILVPALTLWALTAHARGDQDDSVASVLELDRATQGKPVWRARDLPDVVPLCVQLGRLDLAERLLDDAATAPRRPELCVASARAMIAEASGDIESSTAAYRTVAEGWHSFGAPLREAQALLGAARCSASAQGGRKLAARSRDIATDLGVEKYRQEAEVLIAAYGRGPQ